MAVLSVGRKPHGLQAKLLAIALCIGTLAFYALLSVLLSYSILDLISPHSQLNARVQDTADSTFANTSMDRKLIQIPVSAGPFVGYTNGVQIPDSETPWDPNTPTGARVLTLLSKSRFPSSSSPDPNSNSTGMSPPPAVQWPPARYVKPRRTELQIPISVAKLNVLNAPGTSDASGQTNWVSSPPENWNPKSNGFKVSGLPAIQWPGFTNGANWDNDQLRRQNLNRRDWVVRAFTHAWEGYKKTAWGYDQVTPISSQGENLFAGWGAMIIDNLDTLLLMNMTQEYNYARTHVRAVDWSNPIGQDFRRYKEQGNSNPTVNVLESVIRYLGALLSAYDLAGDEMMLSKADELARWLLPAFSTRTGVPIADYQLGSNPLGSASGEVYLSEAGGLTLEFTRLAQVTGKTYYLNAVQKAFDFLQSPSWNSTKRVGSLFPQTINPEHPTDLLGIYNLKKKSSNYYDSLIKEAMLLRGNIPKYQESYSSAIDSVLQYLSKDVKLGGGASDLTVVGESYFTGTEPVYHAQLSQQACSSAATIGLGARLLNKEQHLNFSLNYTDTCLWLHESSLGGLGPEELVLKDYRLRGSHNNSMPISEIYDPMFRGTPETIESVFYMWRLTGDRQWQDRGWNLFTRWVEATISPSGFAELSDVTQDVKDDGNKLDRQNGALVSEHLKYLYLLFSDPQVISLDGYVLNAAGHAFQVPGAGNQYQVNWRDPQQELVAYLNPPVQNIMASRNLSTDSTTGTTNSTSYGTYLQQWYQSLDSDNNSSSNPSGRNISRAANVSEPF